MTRKNKLSPTIEDVAAAAGVSITTVSRVLNDRYGVASDTYSRVKSVVEELGYTSSLAARSMRSHKTNVIGVIIIDLSDPFSIELIKGIGQAIKVFGYDLIVYSSGHNATDTESAWEREHVARLNGSITDGLIITTPTTINFPSAYPLVTVDPHKEDGGFPAVLSTNRDGSLAVMGYLIGLGHRRIGFVGGRSDLLSASRRLQGYEDGLRQAGLTVAPELVEEGDYTRQTGFACAQKLLGLSDPPTAIFAANDQSAIGVLEAAAQTGLKVPDDLSVVGFDNIPETAFTSPPLTTVDQFIDDMGYLAIEILVKLIQGISLEDNVYKVQTKIVIRESCRSIA